MALCTITSSADNTASLVKLRIPFRNDKQNENFLARIILVIDRSGSMAGGPWKQVQSAVKAINEMHQTLARDAKLEPIVISYNQSVSVTDLASIQTTTANGSTDFVKVFEQIEKTISEIGIQKRIVIMFMTDGCDTCNQPNVIANAQTKLQTFLKTCGSDCVVHVIGYSAAHDLKMMDTLKTLGTSEGIYRYAEGSNGLDEKFKELFEFVDLTVEFNMKLPNNNESIKITGEIIDSDYVEGECWLSLNENKIQEPIEITIGDNQYNVMPEYVEPDRIFLLKCLSKRASETTTQEELDQIQNELVGIKMFGKNLGGAGTEQQIAMELRVELQTRLDTLHAMMADIARGTLNQTSALAKMNDLRYADKFSKSSRRRRMDQRAVRNQANLQLIDTKLNELKFDPDTAFNNVDLVTFTCCLTLNNCRDMMIESRDDIMGVGLVVERQEHVIDAPTLIVVKDVSVTILSRSACDDAIKMKINIVDASQIHGGFIASSKHHAPRTSTNISQRNSNNQPSEFTRGVAAESINTFLPLYICDAHFERVQVMLEPVLGYLFTLDITGYKDDQLLGLYSILGQMLNIIPLNASEREQIILYEFKRLCHGLLSRTRQYLKEGNDLFEKFLSGPFGRSKAHIQNLMTLFGYIYALDIQTIDDKLRYAIVEEVYRRHFAYIYHGTADNVVNEHLQELLYGKVEENDDQQNQTTSDMNDLSYVKTKNDRTNDNHFAQYARAVLKTNEKNPKIPTEDIRIDFDIPERPISTMNNKIRQKMVQLLSSFSIKPIKTVLDRLGIRMLDVGNDDECLILRSMLVQCLRFHSNQSINSAILDKTFFNAHIDYQQILIAAHEALDAHRQEMKTKKSEEIRSLELARRIVLTNDIHVFIGRMMVYCPTRGGKTFDTVTSLLVDRSQKRVPLLAEKMNVLFTGRYKEHPDAEKEFNIISYGMAWFPDRSMITRVREVLSEDQWNDLDRLMSGRTCGHVYRLSDIPNRHGYHNSHPNPRLVTYWGYRILT